VSPADAALAGLAEALRAGPVGGELLVQPYQAGYQARLELPYQRPGLPPGRVRRDGVGETMTEALVHLWAGPLGVWRYLDPDGWLAAQPVHAPAGNPGPL
jgi:hypothetical protein